MRYLGGTEQVHVALIRPGDAVLFDGKMRTVCRKDLHRDDLMGVTLWGDSFRLGTVPVLRAMMTRQEEGSAEGSGS
jgi:hypothetical protein